MSDIKIVSEKELKLLSHKDIVRFALFCAEQVKDNWKDIPECVAAIETAERWLEGKASAEECRNTAYAADAHAVYTASAAAHAAHATDAAAYYATYVATRAAYSANAAYAYAAYAAAYAAHTDAYATSDAADYAAYGNTHLIEAQRNHYNELLHLDDIAEKLLLGGVV